MSEAEIKSGIYGAERERRINSLYEQLLEIEQRLIPTGLHVFGRAPEGRSHADMLRMVASFSREEKGATALTDLAAEGLRLGDYESLLKTSFDNHESMQSRERVEAV